MHDKNPTAVMHDENPTAVMHDKNPTAVMHDKKSPKNPLNKFKSRFIQQRITGIVSSFFFKEARN